MLLSYLFLLCGTWDDSSCGRDQPGSHALADVPLTYQETREVGLTGFAPDPRPKDYNLPWPSRDFVSRLMALAGFWMNAAHAVISGAAYRKSGSGTYP
jgi:hypothetical protein